MSSLTEVLRDRTRIYHERMHDVVDLDWMTSSINAYRLSLQAYLQAIAPLEKE